MTPAAPTRETLFFGPFRLIPSERLLTRDGAPVVVSSRALDVLITLVSQPERLFSKSELLAHVWPDVTVEEGSLRFHIAGLRKVLGDGKDGARYIETLRGRGYCFVGQLIPDRDTAEEHMASAPLHKSNLPPRLTGMLGRDDDVLKISRLLTAGRFVTVVGAGGIGKTTVAIAVGHHQMTAFAGAVLFVDLSVLSDRRLVATTLASALGLMVHSDDGTPSLIAYLRDKRVLLVLDTCEHLIEAVATVASRIVTSAPQVHVLATSREPLRVEDEHVYKLETLACPSDDRGVSVAVVREYPATRLFLERATASGIQLDLGDAEAAIVVGICLKLDGVALAIELAARHVGAYGLHQTAALLDQRLMLLWLGTRTASPRQKTLQATLDWSFGLLSEAERVVLRRLAVFVGHFTLDAALAVVTSATTDQAVVFSAIDSLVAKSMVATSPVGAMMRYRLLDTTRAYALNVGMEDAERCDLAARHACYYRRWLEQTGAEWPTHLGAVERATHLAALNNVRAALEWCFGADGSSRVGIGLATAAAPMFMAMSLLKECHRWSERAVLALDETSGGGVEEMHLRSASAMSLMFTRGSTELAQASLTRSLSIAEECGDTIDRLQRLSSLQMLYIRMGEFGATLDYARRSIAVATNTEEPAAMALARSMLGISLHLTGQLDSARLELEAALRSPRFRRTSAIHLGFDHHNRSSIILARTLWLQGYSERAAECARETIADAVSTENPVTLYVALIWAIPLFFWAGDLESVGAHTVRFIAHAEAHSLGPHSAIGRGLNGALASRRGFPDHGVDALRSCLEELHAMRYELLSRPLSIELAVGLAAIGRIDEGIATIDDAIRLVDASGDQVYMPELLRVKGGLHLSEAQSRADEAEACFLLSLEWSRRQGAKMWELQAANDLATLWINRGRADAARALLLPVFARFEEGMASADLKKAERLLETL
jgi:predicted ATPase/DNA-binding winged helix-turn-helix (wHTH) protein